MATDLSQHIDEFVVVDTHEHIMKEADWTQRPPDVLSDLFDNYAPGDLATAGATPEAVRRALDSNDADVEGRWAGIARAWEAIRLTGYGQAVQWMARNVYDIDELCAPALRGAGPKLRSLTAPGQRLRLLRNVAKLDHAQVDDASWPCGPDASGPEFFLYDLSWRTFSSGRVDFAALAAETGITVRNLATLRQAMQTLFDRYAPFAIAVKTQHAYDRTLRWEHREDADAQRALESRLAGSDDPEVKLCLGDWCLARGVELAEAHNLPVKIHTGYYYGNNHMVSDRIRPGHLCPLLLRYPRARFVLMHSGYPYTQELIAVVKHFPSTWADLCWAWSIDPYTTKQFVRQFLHAVPVNKLFGFGGDTWRPTSAVAYSMQMRQWLARTLREEIDAGDLTEPQAIDVATRLLRDNQLACFDVAGKRGAIRKEMQLAQRAEGATASRAG